MHACMCNATLAPRYEDKSDAEEGVRIHGAQFYARGEGTESLT